MDELISEHIYKDKYLLIKKMANANNTQKENKSCPYIDGP